MSALLHCKLEIMGLLVAESNLRSFVLTFSSGKSCKVLVCDTEVRNTGSLSDEELVSFSSKAFLMAVIVWLSHNPQRGSLIHSNWINEEKPITLGDLNVVANRWSSSTTYDGV